MKRVPAGLIVFGFGGHARSVADIALASGIRHLVFVDEAVRPDETLLGFPAMTAFEEPLPEGWQAFPAAGDNRARFSQVRAIQARSWPLATLISPSATIGVAAQVAPGSFIGHHAHVGPLSTIGTACIINTGAIIDHESQIGDYTHISVNSSVAGRCRIGSFVFLGTGSVVIDQISVTDSVRVGAGGVVIKALVEPGTYVGVPVQKSRKNAD
jgi:UDP-N-acetylbacillosamine N-acetyltransferase